jgi:diguanylate cyclase (GGDEF)-like protein
VQGAIRAVFNRPRRSVTCTVAGFRSKMLASRRPVHLTLCPMRIHQSLQGNKLPTSPSDQPQQLGNPLAHSAALEKCADELRSAERALAESNAALQTAKEREKQARSLALHDPLTKLANRGLFDEQLANAIAIANRRSWSLAVVFLDLDAFKAINDAHGHSAGDTVLQEIADRLMQCSREEDSVCRTGGDEFLYLLIDPKNRNNIEAILLRAMAKIRAPLEVDDQKITIGVSAGIAVYPEDGLSGGELIAKADSAMYQAKTTQSGFRFCAESTPASEEGIDLNLDS